MGDFGRSDVYAALGYVVCVKAYMHDSRHRTCKKAEAEFISGTDRRMHIMCDMIILLLPFERCEARTVALCEYLRRGQLARACIC